MYFCYVHNWSSQTYSCPSCHKVDTFTSDKVCIDYNPNDNHAEYLKLYNKYQQLKNANEKLIAELLDISISCEGCGHHADVAIAQFKKDVGND